MVDYQFAVVTLLLLMIAGLLWRVLALLQFHFDYRNRGPLACLSEINEGISVLVGTGHVDFPPSDDGDLAHELKMELEFVNDKLSDILDRMPAKVSYENVE